MQTEEAVIRGNMATQTEAGDRLRRVYIFPLIKLKLNSTIGLLFIQNIHTQKPQNNEMKRLCTLFYLFEFYKETT